MKGYVRTIFLLLLTLFPLGAFASDNSPFQMPASIRSNLITININQHFTSDTVLSIFNGQQPIYGLSVNMSVVRNTEEFLVRVILEDYYGEDRLIAETYNELAENDTIVFANHCEETALMDGVIPDKIKIIVKGAETYLSELKIINNSPLLSSEKLSAYRDSINRSQVAMKASIINSKIIQQGKLWHAGVTETSLLSYSEKKILLGYEDENSWGGIEYYVGGIFEFGKLPVSLSTPLRSSPYVQSFDWRNVYGRNWLTSVKNQYAGPFCVAFASIGSLEAMSNLYYNRLLDMDLSEYEIACCAVGPEGQKNSSLALNFIQSQGVVCDEDYGSYSSFASVCRSDTISTPHDIISINNYQSVITYSNMYNMEEIKRNIIQNGPQIIEIYPKDYSSGHAMVLVGYGEIYEGMVYYPQLYSGSTLADTIHSGSPYIGQTFLICKNSWGTNYGENGYMKILVDSSQTIINVYSITTPIYSTLYTEDDKIVEDADNDGYYSWGIGPKPLQTPNWAPLFQDADDSNPYIGGLNTYGHVENINPNENPVIFITSPGSSFHGQYDHQHITIQDGGSVIFDQEMHFFNDAKITVESGGELIVTTGGLLYNAILELLPGSRIRIVEGGKIIMKKGHNFLAPIGVEVVIEHGSIE